ncbi:MAG: DUF1549 domain-containing protein, partial [Planctomycetes bacterium]|nr:DUF1549 domain-containing protein [Planctomycetota bacterium]
MTEIPKFEVRSSFMTRIDVMRGWFLTLVLTGFTALGSTESSRSEESIVALPSIVKLTGPESHQTLLVQRVIGSRVGNPISVGVSFQSKDEKIAKVIEGRVIPVANGQTQIVVRSEHGQSHVEVVVERMTEPFEWSFRNHVQSVFSKTGCNSGACHGAAAGKNGFKLSLRGYDPESDFYSITRQSRGRRVDPEDPAQSLVVSKPTGAIPHKGGVRFSEDSLEYRVVSEWIAQGQKGPSSDDPRIVRLELLPESVELRPGAQQPTIVIAHFSDGHTEDVTQWAKFTSTNHSVCQVDDQGRVSVSGSGEGAIVAWYLAQNAIGTVTVPFEQVVAEEQLLRSPKANFIDEIVLEKLTSLNVPPSPRCDDSVFIRRVFLDTIGMLPNADETRSFLNDSNPQKRSLLIEQLLSRPEYVDYWAYQWSDLLLLTGSRLKAPALKQYYQWIRDQVTDNTP